MISHFSLLLLSFFFALTRHALLVRGSADGLRCKLCPFSKKKFDQLTFSVRPQRHNRMQNSTLWILSSPTAGDFQSTARQPYPSSYTTRTILSESSFILHSTRSTPYSGSAGLPSMAGWPSQTMSDPSRAASDNIKPTATYGTGRTKPWFLPLNSTHGKTGFPSSGPGQDVLPSDCSGTYTIGPTKHKTVTITTTEIVGTTTIAYGAPIPHAVFVKPLPFCTTLIASNCTSDG